MKADSSTLLSEFEDLGYELSDPQVIDGLCALCDIYSLSEEHLSCLYLTYSSETPNSKEELSAFENQILVPLKAQSANKGKSKHLHDANSLKKLQARQIQAEGENDDLIALSYGQSAKDEIKPRMIEPRPPSVPEIQSPFRKRSNAGETLTKFGVPAKEADAKVSTIDIGPPEVLGTCLSRPYSYMFERLREAAGVLDEILCRQSDTLMEKYPQDLEGGLEGDISIVNTEPFSAFGRICCEESEGKLNSRSVLLQGSMDASGGRSLLMEINNLKEYSIFPGQIVGFKGTNPHGGKLMAENIITDGSPPIRKDVKKNRREFSLIVSSGPFTTKDDLNFAPLKELLKQIRNSKPEYAILCGPFLDEKHPLLSGTDKENISEMGENDDDESYDSMFAHRVIKPISDTLNECPHTRIIMVPSSRDIHHIPIYPTPPFDSSLNNDRIHMLSDPCLFLLEGIVIGVTSTDTLFHLTKNEISNPGRNQDRLKRLSRHLLQQRSFYPMYPPNSDVNMDIEKCEAHSRIDVKPDVLILPSDLMHFIKDVDGTLVVNPSRLSRGTGGGVYSKIKINNKGEDFLKNVFANIVRI